ncbi:DNA adenine methylase [Deinococcus sp. VB142]|uniref:site-specific DNA-methyltransferase (adenine-specific) n=1 Tax=Deinococcus sp. VB142 TaxID=3112952 RepID=A0AAU6Q4H3_9DEIO
MARYNTPLRYPGGKQKLTPFVVDVIERNNLSGCQYVEPYAGGAGVAMELLMDDVVSSVYLNDFTYPVYAFWKTIKYDPDFLCARILSASLTVEEWLKRREIVRNPEMHSLQEVAYSFFYLNRCNRSGVVGGGLIGGLQQNGTWKMDARFSRNDLIGRVERIAKKADRIFVSNMDAEAFIEAYTPPKGVDAFFYFDPPYIGRSARLYLNDYSPEDHKRLAVSIQASRHKNWIVSYDYDARIVDYYVKQKQFEYQLQYNAAAVYKGRELFIFSDCLHIPESTSFRPINDVLNPPIPAPSLFATD